MSGIGTPYENMATDEALFDAACTSGVPVLRFYGWTPATASLGFAQRASEALDFTEMDRRHVAWVRRPTGGRAVLHDMEVTYSVSVPQSDPLYALGLEASYEWICGPIVAALLAVGVSAALAPHGSTGFVSTSCFTAPGTTDIVAGERKIVGSAQMRTRDGFLQHGSVILKNDLEKLFAVVRTSQPDVHDAARRATPSYDKRQRRGAPSRLVWRNGRYTRCGLFGCRRRPSPSRFAYCAGGTQHCRHCRSEIRPRRLERFKMRGIMV